MSASVWLHEHERVLALFAQAITGRVYHVRSEREFSGSATSHRAGHPLHDRDILYLPERIDRFRSRAQNRRLYRLMALQQIGHLEFGSYRFDIHHAREHIAALARRSLPQPERPESDFETLYRHFPLPALARQLFRLLEGARIERHVLRRYPGVRRDFERIAALELAKRRPLALVAGLADLTEALLRWSIGEPAERLVARDGTGVLAALLEAAATIDRRDAEVYDSAEALARCYAVLEAAGLRAVEAEAMEGTGTSVPAKGSPERPSEGAPHGSAEQRSSGASEHDAPLELEPLSYQAAAPAEWLQRAERLADWRARHATLEAQARAERASGFGSDAAPSEAEGVRVEAGETRGTGIAPGAGATERAREIERETLERRIGIERFRIDQALGRGERHHGPSFLYDEWDSIAGRYLRGWCRLYEERLQGRADLPIRAMLERVAPHQAAVRKRFEQIKPFAYERLRHRAEGEELDLEQLVEHRVETRRGRSPDGRVYARRERVGRDVAALFLIDLSASTDDPLEKPHAQRDAPPRRIIDVQRESLLVMARALETLRDAYAIYGFSGYGRDNVELYVVKDFRDPFDHRTLGALAAMKPRRSTRMGPAIRHGIARLRATASALKVLILVSDGFPQDCDYGPDRADHGYGVEDTAKALTEAQRAGIEPFCVTVDRAGHDYLKRMCPPMRYMIIEELEALPEALSKVYQRLTGR